MSGGVEVRGAAQLRATLTAAGKSLEDLRGVNVRVGAVIAAAAMTRAPVRTGALLGSINADPAAMSVSVKAGVVYAGPIHWGWPARNIRPHPFLSDAATSTEDTWVGLYFAELERVVGTVHGA